jgi:tRNA threonylcarbamoyladenosine modification (KEOPS) complex  Pcc1 subunit
MKAVIKIQLNSNQKQIIHDAIAPDMRVTERAETKIKVTPKGLEILIKASDVTSLRASMNTCLKLLETSLKVMKNAREGGGTSKGEYNKAAAIPAAITGINAPKTKHSNSRPGNRKRSKRVKN